MNMTSSGSQFEVAYWPAMTLGGAAQVAAAHYPKERTLDLAVCSKRTNPPMTQPATLWPSSYVVHDDTYPAVDVSQNTYIAKQS